MARNKFDVDEILEKDSEFNFARLVRLKKYVKPYMNRIVKTTLVVVTSSVIGMASPYILKITLDTAIPSQSVSMVAGLAAALLAIIITNIFFNRYKILTMSKVGQSIIRDIRKELFVHLQDLPFAYYDSRPHGKILVRVVNNINSLSDMFTNSIINLANDLFSLVVIVAIMFTLNTRLALVSMAGLPFLILATYIIRVMQRKAWRLYSMKNSNLNAYIHESIAGMKITQGFVREEENMKTFQRVSTSVKQTWLEACRIAFLMTPVTENISALSTAFLYTCAVAWMTGESATITLGTVIAFSGYIGRFWGPINSLAQIYNQIVVNMTYLERIFEAIDEPVLVRDVENAETMKPITGEIEFRDVTFSYDAGRPILNNVSFKCAPGDSIALVGPTGAGKTTIINLVSRFYDLDSGQVLIDGTDIHSVTLKSLRSQMGIMLQDSFIFSGTIMDNIRYSRLDATDDEVIAAAKAVRAHEFIIEMENGYNTEVNERGSRLSVGQRQLISFARALLADPRILILDEATSSIDTKTELALQEGLNNLLKGRTSFIIAHRLSTIKNSTRIMYINHGTICEAGTHDELMELKGEYYHLYTSQYAFLDAI